MTIYFKIQPNSRTEEKELNKDLFDDEIEYYFEEEYGGVFMWWR